MSISEAGSRTAALKCHGLGHFPQLEAPERVNGLIAEFCR